MLVEVTKALADENRLRIIAALERSELCVCQLTELLGLAASTVSKHLFILRSAGLISNRKSGRWVYCSLNLSQGNQAARSAINFVLENKRSLTTAKTDHASLSRIIKTSPELLCQ